MKRAFWIAAAMLTAVSSAPAAADEAPVAPEALRAELDLAYAALKEGSPGLYRFTSKAKVDRAFAEARKRVDRPMTSVEFYRVMAPAIASIRNGHTTFSASAETWKSVQAERLLPLGARVIDGRVYVLRDFSGAAHSIAGAEIVRINGRPAADLINEFNRSASLDGTNPTSRDRNNSGWGLIYNLPLIADVHAPFVLSVRGGRFGSRQVKVDGLTNDQLVAKWKQYPADREAAHERKSTLRFDKQAAVLTIPHWDYVEEGKRSMLDDVGDWFSEINKRAPKALIIDIRSNGGGDETVATALFQRLYANPFREYGCIGVNGTDFAFLRYAKDADEMRKNLADYTQAARPSCRWLAPLELKNRPNIGVQRPVQPGYSGKVIVLTDGGSFSTSAEFAALVRNYRRGILVGEETSGSYYGSNSGIIVPLVLPNSKLELAVPTVSYWLNVRQDVPKDRGIVPDHAVRETIEDMIAGRDRVMAEALRLARP